MNFGKLIKELRKKNNLSLEKLGELVNMSHQQLSSIENGKSNCTVEFAHRLLSVLKGNLIIGDEDVKERWEFRNMEVKISEDIKEEDYRIMYYNQGNKKTKKEIVTLSSNAIKYFDINKVYKDIKEEEYIFWQDLMSKVSNDRIEDLKSNNINVKLFDDFNINYWDAIFYKKSCSIAEVSLGDKKVNVEIEFKNKFKYFDLKGLINDLKNDNLEDGYLIEKILIFSTEALSNKYKLGKYLYSVKDKSIDDLVENIPLFKSYKKDTIAETFINKINSKENKYIVEGDIINSIEEYKFLEYFNLIKFTSSNDFIFKYSDEENNYTVDKSKFYQIGLYLGDAFEFAADVILNIDKYQDVLVLDENIHIEK